MNLKILSVKSLLNTKYISMFLMMLLSLNMSAKPRFCINCKYYKKNELGSGDEFGRCMLFKKETPNYNYYVSGQKEEIEYKYCVIARQNEDLCGIKGNKYIKKKV